MDVKIEEDKHWWFASRTRAILGLLDRYVGAAPATGRRILDVGCGAGNMMHHLAQYGTVVGIDPNPKPLLVARQRGYNVEEGAADNIPFGNDSFGLVALLDTIEHVANESGTLHEVYRVLQPGGFLIVTVPAFMFLWSRNDVINYHQRRYTLGELKTKLAHHGFKPLHTSYNNFFIFPVAAGLILARRGTAAEPQMLSPHFDDDAYQVEMEPARPLVNTVLTQVGRVEATLVCYVALPFGTSVICLAQKQLGQGS